MVDPVFSLVPVELGQKLFFGPRLSGDGTVACATCHDPARAFTGGSPTWGGKHKYDLVIVENSLAKNIPLGGSLELI